MSDGASSPPITTSFIPPLHTITSSPSPPPHPPFYTQSLSSSSSPLINTYSPSNQPPEFSPTFLGTTFNTSTILLTLVLSVTAVCLNAGVVYFHWTRVKSSVISFMYTILGTSDLCTGLCAMLHTVLFVVLQVQQGYLTPSLMWLVVPAYFLTVVAFKVSAFVSMMISVIRTISVVCPLRKVNKRAASLAVGLYALFWVVMFAADIAVILDVYEQHAAGHSAKALQEIASYFYYPNKCKWAEYLAQKHGHYTPGNVNLECLVDAMYTVPPFFLCAGIALVATVIQVAQLICPQNRYKTEPNESQSTTSALSSPGNRFERDSRDLSITIVLISTVFIVCMSLTLYQPLHFCVAASALKNRRVFYMMGYLPFFINAALNPVILLCRERKLRVFLWRKLRGRDDPVNYRDGIENTKISTAT